MAFPPPTGTYEDLLLLFVRTECLRTDRRLFNRSVVGRLLFEPFWNIMGLLAAAAASCLPAGLLARLQDRLFLSLQGRKKGLHFDGDSAALSRAWELAHVAERASGRPPALLCLTDHPPAGGDLFHLNPELMRHAMLALRRLRAGSCRPRLINAVDYFALDMLKSYQEAAYSGFMGSYHLGVDRLFHLRGAPSRRLLADAPWPSACGRIVRALRDGEALVMVLGGGVPTTSRVYYCVREFLIRARERRPSPGPVPTTFRRLRKESPDFIRFCQTGPVGPHLRRSLWRMIEAWVLSKLAVPAALDEADQGRLHGSAREALLAAFRALGWKKAEPQRLLGELEEEFSRSTPYRERFFRMVASRVAGKGTPVVLLPLTYGSPEAVRLRFGEPAALTGLSDGNVRLLTPAGKEFRKPLDRFCRDFTKSVFS